MKKNLIASLAAAAFVLLIACSNEKKPGVTHLVMMKFKSGASSSQVDAFTEEFKSLEKRIPVITSFTTGLNNSPENLNRGFTHIYVLTFADTAARNEYLVHPEHKKFGEYIGQTGILDEVFVFDY